MAANARLIARAPQTWEERNELLEALKMAMVVMAENDLSHTPESNEVFNQCKAAIAKIGSGS